MRVIAGEFRSRLLKSVSGPEVRPTPNRLRETLFNILAPELPGCVFVDAYAGSGAVGIEALSRGAARAIFIEKSREAIEVLEANLKSLRAGERASVLRIAVRKKLSPDLGDIVFLDPPYSLEAEYGLVLEAMGEHEGRIRLVIAQHSSRQKLEPQYGLLERYRELRQGENALSFYRLKVQEAEAQSEPQPHTQEF